MLNAEQDHKKPESPYVNELEAKVIESGLSIAAVCKRAKVAQSTWQRWKKNAHSPTYSVVWKLEQAINELSALKVKKGGRSSVSQ